MPTWTVQIKKGITNGLPTVVKNKLITLINHLQAQGPVMGKWPNYSKLEERKNRHHCHLKNGRPTYVAVWEVVDKDNQIIRITYVGTRENAPY